VKRNFYPTFFPPFPLKKHFGKGVPVKLKAGTCGRGSPFRGITKRVEAFFSLPFFPSRFKKYPGLEPVTPRPQAPFLSFSLNIPNLRLLKVSKFSYFLSLFLTLKIRLHKQEKCLELFTNDLIQRTR